MKTFTDRFLKILHEQPEEPVMTDTDAASAELEPGTDPAMLDVQDVPDVDPRANPANDMVKQQNVQFAGQISEWVGKVEGFIEYLNGIGPESVNSQINSAPCDTIMDDIARSETKKIGRIAQDLRSLSESLKSYLIANDD